MAYEKEAQEEIDELRNALWDLWIVFATDAKMTETQWYERYGYLINKKPRNK